MPIPGAQGQGQPHPHHLNQELGKNSPWRRQWHPTPVLLPGKIHGRRSLVGCTVHGVEKSQARLSDFTFTFHFHALEKEMATHSSVLAWRIPGTEKPSGLLSMGLHRVGHDWSDLAAAAAPKGSSQALPLWLSWYRIRLQCRRPGFDPWVGKMPWRTDRLPTPVFWPGEFHGLYSPWGCRVRHDWLSLSLSKANQGTVSRKEEKECRSDKNSSHIR